MIPREDARRAIEFQGPERLPVQFEALGLNDFHHVKWNQIGVGDKKLSTSTDEWGCEWRRSEVTNMGQVKVHPLAEPSAMGDYHWPDLNDPVFYSGIEPLCQHL